MEKEKKDNKLTAKQKELLITIVVLLLATLVGFYIGKWLFETLHG